MKRTTRLLISAVAGVLAVVLALGYGDSVRAEAQRAQRAALEAYGDEVATVCVAARDIEPGEMVDETNVVTEEWVASLLPDDALTSLDDVVGTEATSRIPARAVLTPLYFERDDEAIAVPKGKVAVSVAVDEQRAVGGAISPGDSVDVYVSSNGIADLLCRATVIDASNRLESQTDSAITWVTLAIDPETVTEVLAATAKGTVSLALPGAEVDDADLGAGEVAREGEKTEGAVAEEGEDAPTEPTEDASGETEGEAIAEEGGSSEPQGVTDAGGAP